MYNASFKAVLIWHRKIQHVYMFIRLNSFVVVLLLYCFYYIFFIVFIIIIIIIIVFVSAFSSSSSSSSSSYSSSSSPPPPISLSHSLIHAYMYINNACNFISVHQ